MPSTRLKDRPRTPTNRNFTQTTTPTKLKAQTLDEIRVIEEWRVGKHDKGSTDVEIGLLTQKISEMEDIFKSIDREKFRSKFYSLRRQFLETIHNRRKKLDYLKNTATDRYYKALERLGMCA